MSRVIPAAVAFVLGLVVGALLLAPWLGDAAPEVVDEELASAAPAPAPALPAPAPTATPLPPAPAVPAAPRGPAPAPALPAAGTDGSAGAPAAGAPPAAASTQSRPLLSGVAVGNVEVEVVTADGEHPGDGDVYARAAGEQHTWSGQGYYFSNVSKLNPKVMLEVPAGQPLDIGYIGPAGQVLVTDVIAPPGGVRRLTLQLPPGKRITVTLDKLPSTMTNDDGAVVVTFWPEDEGGVQHPGRGQRGEPWSVTMAFTRAGTKRSPAMPPGRYSVGVKVHYSRGKHPKPGDPRYSYLPSSETVDAGGAVTLTRSELARLDVRLVPSGQGSPSDRCGIIAVRHPPTPGAFIYLGQPPYSKVSKQPDGWPIRAGLTPGTYHLEWGGALVRGGKTEAFTLEEGGVLQRDLTAVYGGKGTGDPRNKFLDAQRRARNARESRRDTEDEDDEDPEPQPVVIPPDPRADPFDGPALRFHTAFRATGDEEAEGWSNILTTEDDGLYLDRAERRRLLPPVATRNGNWASRPLPVEGPWEPKFHPAGMLLLLPIKPERPPKELETPALTIEREDGAALPFSRDSSALRDTDLSEFAPSETGGRVPLKLGILLGPLVAGPQRFVVRRGSFVLGTVEVVVEAGAVRALEIR